MTVAAFNLLETFLEARIHELAIRVNGGQVQFLDLPEAMQARAIKHTLDVARSRLRRQAPNPTGLRDFSSALGQSLSAVGASLDLSANMWLWEGSNASADDYSTALKYFHVDTPWDTAGKVAERLGFPGADASGSPINLRAEFQSLAQERHKSAHVSSHSITTIWLRAVPDAILRFAICFDALASTGAHLFHRGDAAMLRDSKHVNNSRVAIRFVRERSNGYADYSEGATRATKAGEFSDVLQWSCGRATGAELVVVQNAAKNVTNWMIPAVD